MNNEFLKDIAEDMGIDLGDDDEEKKKKEEEKKKEGDK